MEELGLLAISFEEHRAHLRAVAYRMLGSLSEAEDAVQEAWLRISRADASAIENLAGWMTTVLARVCLDALRSRRARREQGIEAQRRQEPGEAAASLDPEQEAMLADSVGLALLVLLDTLGPAERLAFVLHEMLALPFEEIAAIVGRTPMAVRQLASRARRRIQGADVPQSANLKQQRSLVDAFLAALRGGDLSAMMAVLDPDVVVRADRKATPLGVAVELRGEQAAKSALSWARGARLARPALVDGRVGVVVAPNARLLRVLSFTFARGKIAGIEVFAEAEALQRVALGVLS